MANGIIGLRLWFFIPLLVIITLLEIYLPKRKPIIRKTIRAWNNIFLFSLNSVLTKIFMPLTTVMAAIWAQNHNFGLLNVIKLPSWAHLAFVLVILDFVLYAQHRIFHKLPTLWRIHKVHHSDIDVDCTTATRVHSLEIVFSIFIRCIEVALLGASPESALIFEIALNSALLFNHGNFRINYTLEQYLRLIIVTPDMHRIHHSISAPESNSNYGPIFSFWDKWFCTYKAYPKNTHENMSVGVSPVVEAKLTCSIIYMLKMPFI